jgi:uncharacterized protein
MAEIPIQIKEEMKILKEKLKGKLDVDKIIIFGSYARGNYSHDSDIDVCIIADKIINNFLSTMTAAPIAASIDPRIEPVVFSKDDYLYDSDFGLLKEIKNSGIEM